MKMSATSSISSAHSSSNSGNSGNNNSNSNPNNVISSASNIVILDNQILDSNDVVAAAGLQQLSSAGAGGLKLTRDCAVQYSNLISSYTASSNSSGNNNHGNTAIVGGNSSSQMNTVNIIQGDATQTNSRVQVLSNVQLVSSKGASQPSTFSYVDASGKNFNVLTSSGKLSTNKLISVPITKVKTFNHLGQQQQQQQHQLPSQQTQIVSSQITSHQSQPQPQKVTVPRNIQLVTRIPNSTISVSNGRVSQITPTLSSSPQQLQQPAPQFTIQQYPDSSANLPPSLEIRSSASGPIINSTNTGNIGKAASTKSKNTASLKMMQNSQINQPSMAPTTKSVGKGVSVNLKSVRNNSKTNLSAVNSPQYYIKNSSNGTMSQSGTTTSIYTTSPAQAVYHNPTPHPHQHQMQIPINSTTSKSRGVYKTSKNQLIQIQQQQQQQQQHQQQQPHQSPQRSLTPSSSPVGGAMPSNVTFGAGGTTTVVQGATSSSSVTFDSSGSSTMTGGGIGGHHEHPVPSVTVTGYSSSTGKNKKYGPVIQNETNNPSFVLSPVKTKGTGRGRNNSTSNYQPAEAVPYQRYSASPSRPHQQQQFQTSPHTSGPGQYHQQSTAVNRDDQVFLNGQQMTDESSARILQSLSQRSSESSASKYSGYKQQHPQPQQQQFTFYGSDNVPQSPTSNVAPIGSSSTNTTGVIYDPSDARFYEDKHDGRRLSSSEVITYADNIPLREGYPASYNYNHRDDDEHIGVEVRPAPVDTSNGRYQILQAIFQDHTYFASLPEMKQPEPQPPPAPTPPQQTQLHQTSIPTTISHHQPPPLLHHQQQQQHQFQQMLSSSQQKHYLQQSQPSQPLQQPSNYKQQTNLPTSVPSSVIPQSSSAINVTIPSSAGIPVPLTQANLGALIPNSGSVAIGAGILSSPVCASTVTTTTSPTIMIGKQLQPQPQSTIPGSALDYIYQRQSIPPQDDDANSVISTGSRNYNSMDIDLGEETETAPEGEGEDDSVTRCICDLTHDDGYMICCDKCSAWQHVDCMGIDRTNIPDEYNCEMCQPRPVDRTRARTLQMEKRKEQSLLIANNNLQLPVGDAAVTSTNLVGVPGGVPVTTTTGGKGANQYTTGKVLAGSKKSKASGSSSKKKSSGESAAAKKATKKALDALNRVNGKRKELKKPSKKKVKTTEQNAEKMSNMIRTWIDNYERAITNHYSPELRARLQAFGKMQSQNPLLNSERLIPGTTPVANLAQKCTTVPHAGGKILISTEEIEPKTPIIEIRGKYMLSSQHKPLQSLFNMAANGKLSNNKNAGPFLFLYQVTQGGMELCVDTRTYGNDARFVRRSCRPNAEILHNVEKGVVHLYVVSTTNIKSNTEITIKHDEHLIQRVGGVVILTHTTVTKLCACGLIKECQYSSQLSDGLLPAGNALGTATAATSGGIMPMSQGGVCSTTPPVLKPTKSKKNNGALVDGEKKPAKKRNSRSTSSNPDTRLRSISSSGDSTSEMMLFVQQQQQQLQQQNPGPLQQSPLHQPPLSPLQPVQPTFQPTPSQLVHQQLQQTALHFMQQSQHGLMQQSQPVYMYSPPPTAHHSQVSAVQPPPVAHSPTPPPHPVPPMSPVMNVTHRAGFYTEIKSPLSTPPPLNLSGPPPLVIPTLPSSFKPSPQQPPPLQPMTDKSPQSAIPPSTMNVPALAVPNLAPNPSQEQVRQEFQQQQHFHQQQLMEEIIKIKIKSPKASPMKQEYLPPLSTTTTTTTTTSMLSPPPPPPNPIAQRLRCAESLKQELFHSHYQAQVRPPSPLQSPPIPTIQQTPVKVEYTPPVEPKQEPTVILETPLPVVEEDEKKPPVVLEIKTEEDVKPEPVSEPDPVVKLEDPLPASNIKVEEPESVEQKSPVKEVKEEPPTIPQDQDSKEAIDTASLCNSATSSPVKSHPAASANPGNSTNSSPHSTSSQHHPNSGGSGSSSKKKNNPFRETEKEKKEKLPSRKLTREERKMEAIVKAFEKMEQSQQRKQELKEQRKEGKRRSVSSSTPDEGTPSGASSAKKKNISAQKRKKKKSKSLSQHFGSPTQSRKKKVSKSAKKSKNARVLSLDQEEPVNRPHESKAAELLVTFSHTEEQSSNKSSYFGDDVKPLAESATPNNEGGESVAATAESNIPLLSSACMLIEAAVGPLEQASSSTSAVEQDFKFPQKAKTKKSMSREWLSGQAADVFRRNTPDQDSGYISEEKSHDYRRTPFEETGITPLGVDVSEPSICIVAKKVEEFIAQNSPQPDEVAKWDEKVSTSSATASSSQEHPQTPTGAGNVSESAAAKKRWLRQAISEETDELTQASSSPPPPNGFTTPLKKRRVIRQSEETSQPQSHQQQQQATLLSAQKIDFADHSTPPHHPQQPVLINTQQSYPESNLQWATAGPPPLSYPFGISENKQAMDLSRTAAPPLLMVQQQRMQPYKIVPIAQALTPLHFTDPDPLPSTTPPMAPLSAAVHSHRHLIAQESREIIRRAASPSLTVQQHASMSMADYDKLPPPPPSAVAAMVPASLLPPEVPLVIPPEPSSPHQQQQQQQQHARIDVSYPSPASIPGIPRSKGSQKYIGSPAKFEPSSPSQSPSSAVAETPEKSSVPSSYSTDSIVSSDIEEDNATEEKQGVSAGLTLEVETVVESIEETECIVHDRSMDITQEVDDAASESVTGTESTTTIASGGSTEALGLEPVLEKEPEIVQEEEVVISEVLEEIAAEEPMEVSETMDTTSSELTVSQTEEIPEVPQEETVKCSPSPMAVDDDCADVETADAVPEVNDDEKKVKVAPEEDHEKNELEDLQKVIASFHSQNIMNLISRNKKSKKNTSRENSIDGGPHSSRKSSKSRSNASSKEGSVTPTAPPSPPTEEQDVAESCENVTLEWAIEARSVCNPEPVPAPVPPPEPVPAPVSAPEPLPAPVPAPEPVPAPVPPPSEEMQISTLGRSYSHPSWHTTESFRETTEVRSYSTLRPDIPQINYNSPSTYQSKAARELLSSLSTGSEPLSSFTSYRSSTSSFLDYPKSSIGGSTTVTGSTSSSTFQYRSSNEINTLLEKGFSSSRPSSLSSLGPDRSTDRVSSSYLLSSSKVTDNLSTLGSASGTYPKIFTKTASSDPRLNPALTTPEPPAAITPKRKLSINEYRQRKMQSCSTTTTVSAAAASTTAAANTPDAVSTASNCSNSSSSESGGSNQISSSLGSNDVSSSISKELELELEFGEEKSSEDNGEAASKTTTATITGTSEPSSTESTV